MTYPPLNAAWRALLELGLKGAERTALLYIADNSDANDCIFLDAVTLGQETSLSNFRNNAEKTEAERALELLCARGILVETFTPPPTAGFVCYQVRVPGEEPHVSAASPILQQAAESFMAAEKAQVDRLAPDMTGDGFEIPSGAKFPVTVAPNPNHPTYETVSTAKYAGMLRERNGVGLIAQERERQVTKLGWTAEHDLEHKNGELAIAAACYALPKTFRDSLEKLEGYAAPVWWPFDDASWKPAERIKDLTRAGALIAAEIDRLLAAERGKDAESGESR